MNKSEHSYKGHPLELKTTTLVKCNDDTRNPDIGQVEAWVKKGHCYWAKNLQGSGMYQDDVVMDLFDKNHKAVIPNETYQKWKGSRFFPLATICLN